MKKIIFLFCFSVFTFHYSFSQGVWTWMSGDTIKYSSGVFGTQGIPSTNIHPPGLYSSYCWTDLQGNFWLYGGIDGLNNIYDDMWKFNPVSLEWTWVNGSGVAGALPVYGKILIAAPGNTPGARAYSGCAWADTSGNLWLYGGDGNTGVNADLWKYNIASNEWTWMTGPDTIGQPPVYGTQGIPSSLNNPGNRDEISSPWIDKNGKFWMFGGQATGVNDRADMWMYDPSNNSWTWEAGSQNIDIDPIYGMKGIFSPDNTPGSRLVYAMITEANGNFLLFGGTGYNGYSYADLWEYNPSINQWAWLSGTQSHNVSANAGTVCESDSAFYPNARYENRAVWKDCLGNFWMYGGVVGAATAIGDVWVYLIPLNKWARVSQSANSYIYPVYGRPGVPSPSNQPGAKMGSAHWNDNKGNLWIFGGADIGYNRRCDMWRYQPDYACVNVNCNCSNNIGIVTSSLDSICYGSGLESLLTINGNTAGIQWMSSLDSINFNMLSGDTLNIYRTPGTLSQTTYYRASTRGSCGSLSNIVTVHILPAPSVNFTYTINGKQISFHADSVSANVVSYHWDFGDNQVSNDTNPIHTFDSLKTYYICLTVYNGSNCSFTRCQYVSLLSTNVENISSPHSISLYPNPANNELTIEVLNGNTPKLITITNDLGQTLIQLNTYKTKTLVDIHKLAAGIYFVKTQMADGSTEVNKFVKE